MNGLVEIVGQYERFQRQWPNDIMYWLVESATQAEVFQPRCLSSILDGFNEQSPHSQLVPLSNIESTALVSRHRAPERELPPPWRPHELFNGEVEVASQANLL